jgi:arylsulfatase A-like enzyme
MTTRDGFTRRRFLGTALTAATMGGLPTDGARGSAGRPWNFLLILIDDMGWADAGCFGSLFYRTPNIDRLAAQGMRFTNAYAACPVCSPSRACVLTGKYPARLHVTDWIPGLPPPGTRMRVPDWKKFLPPEENTIAELLAPQGYASASIGKWHLGEPDHYPEHNGFALNVAGTAAPQPPSYFSPYRIATLPDGPPGEYLTDRLTDEAVRFLKSTGDRPSFLYMSHFAVHMPIQGKQELAKIYAARIRPGISQSNPMYAAMVDSVDQSVGRLLQQVRESGQADRTVVIFTSDNGGVTKGTHITSSEPLRGEKGTLYEGGIRVPFIIKWPGATKPGSVSDTPVIGADIYPTIAEIAGVSLPAGAVDGESLVPLLRGTRTLVPRALYWHYPHYNLHQALEPLLPSGAIRKGDYKLIEQFEDDSVELFDLRNDIGERYDLATTMPEQVRELRDDLRAWRKRVGAQMPVPDPANYDPRKIVEWMRKLQRGRRTVPVD